MPKIRDVYKRQVMNNTPPAPVPPEREKPLDKVKEPPHHKRSREREER